MGQGVPWVFVARCNLQIVLSASTGLMLTGMTIGMTVGGQKPMTSFLA
jgi:hypothetical protein